MMTYEDMTYDNEFVENAYQFWKDEKEDGDPESLAGEEYTMAIVLGMSIESLRCSFLGRYNLEHDTVDKIKEDALLDYIDYWECNTFECCDCPMRSKLGGESPNNFYKTNHCETAQKLDIIRRMIVVMERDK